MKTFKQWLDDCQNIYTKDYDSLLGESYKVMKLFMKHLDKDPFVIIMSVERSVYRGLTKNQDVKTQQKIIEQNELENQANTNSFRNMLRGHGYKFLPVVGQYQEVSDNSKVTEKVTESSTVVFVKKGESGREALKICLDFAKKYKQDSILVASRDVGFFYYTRDTDKHKTGDIVEIGRFYSNKIGEYYSTFETEKHSLVGYKNFYNDKGKTNKSTTSFEFGYFPIEPIQRYLKEGLIDFETW